MLQIRIKKGREKSLLRHHPWLFSGAIEKIEGEPQSGETVELRAQDGRFLGRGAWSPKSQIAVRISSFNPDEEINADFFRRQLSLAVKRRELLFKPVKTDAVRLVNAESDGLPGLIVDRYNDYLVVQFLSAGAEFWRETIIAALAEISPVTGIYERSDVEVREKEGLELRKGLLLGIEPPELIEICENSRRFLIDIRNGHKTGFYLDQRDNRQKITEFSANREVLNCFAYTGGFAIAALSAGAARVTNVETSADALELLNRNIILNGFNPAGVENLAEDVFQVLRKFRDQGRSFDLIVLDPPKFAESKSQIERASRGYKDINLLAFKLLRPGGILFTFSCSGQIMPELFQKIVADSALDAGKSAQILAWLNQSADHPTALNFPEGHYLKGLVCDVG
ncbi:MAG TPA: class I SAM-dependent methyltransferase [Candidatus Marinimicrobia bacterium]|nr:class I SAM-dependent methyltransferase [Candidatus Neomarinimicrobiota bacterium]HRS52005.1 class I SAM-dependent methyltransferase [Candidatus Neomarinimicrobiota bacterium]HRU91866.1 class I SAM-dependent methyltransferase [Candidatus Neomarinimicrobiota bacterium]